MKIHPYLFMGIGRRLWVSYLVQDGVAEVRRFGGYGGRESIPLHGAIIRKHSSWLGFGDLSITSESGVTERWKKVAQADTVFDALTRVSRGLPLGNVDVGPGWLTLFVEGLLGFILGLFALGCVLATGAIAFTAMDMPRPLLGRFFQMPDLFLALGLVVMAVGATFGLARGSRGNFDNETLGGLGLTLWMALTIETVLFLWIGGGSQVEPLLASGRMFPEVAWLLPLLLPIYALVSAFFIGFLVVNLAFAGLSALKGVA